MAGISAISGVAAGLTSARISTELQVAAIGRAKDAIEFQGEAAVKLIESASIDSNVGQHLDVRV